MKLFNPDLIYFTLKDMRNDYGRTLLNVVGMVVVIFSYLILNAFSQSLGIFSQSTVGSRNLVVTQADLVDPTDASVDSDALQAARQMPASLVSRVSPVIFRHMRINDHMVLLRAAPVEDWQDVFHLALLEGRWPDGTGQIAVGEGGAEAYGWKVGSFLDVYGANFRVSGIFSSPGMSFASIWMPLEQAQQLFGMQHGYQGMYVQVSAGADAEAALSRLQADPRLAGRYTVFFEDTYTRRNNQLQKDLSSLMTVVSNLALLAVTFGTYSATSLSLVERGREVGILRAVGFSHGALVGILELRALSQAWLAYGVSLAAALGYVAYRQAYARMFVLGYQFSFEITWPQVLAGLLLTSGLALLGAWISTRQMLSTSVSSLLRG